MIKSTILKFSLLVVLAVSFTACNKYEEGSNFSLLSAKMRVSNVWTSSSYTIDTPLGSNTANTMTLTIESDGNFTKVDDTFLWTPITSTGTWGFNSDKTQLLLTEGGTVETWDIIKLKNKELKLMLTDTANDIVYTIEFDGE